MFCRRMTVKIAAVNKRKELVSTHTPLDPNQGQGNKENELYSTLSLSIRTLSSAGPVLKIKLIKSGPPAQEEIDLEWHPDTSV